MNSTARDQTARSERRNLSDAAQPAEVKRWPCAACLTRAPVTPPAGPRSRVPPFFRLCAHANVSIPAAAHLRALARRSLAGLTSHLPRAIVDAALPAARQRGKQSRVESPARCLGSWLAHSTHASKRRCCSGSKRAHDSNACQSADVSSWTCTAPKFTNSASNACLMAAGRLAR